MMEHTKTEKTTVKAVSNKYKKYQILFEESPLGIFKTTLDGKFLEVNAKFAAIFGYSSAQELLEATPQVSKLYVSPELQSRIVESLKKKQGKTLTAQLEFYKKSREQLYARVSYRITFDPNLKINTIEAFLEDITEKHALEMETRQLNKIIEGSNIIIFRWENLPEWPVNYVSENVERILGYTADSLIKGEIRYEELIHPEDITRVKSEIELHTQQKAVDRFLHEPYRLRLSNGEYHWFEDQTSIIFDNEKISYFEGALTNINEKVIRIKKQKKAEKDREYYLQELEFINQVIVQTSKIQDIQTLCDYLANTLHKHYTQALVAVSLYEPERDKVVIKSVGGIDLVLDKLVKTLGYDPRTLSFDREILLNDKKRYTSGKLEEIEGGLYSVFKTKADQKTTEKLEASSGFSRVYTIGFSLNNDPFGAITMFLPENGEIRHVNGLETIANNVALSINQLLSQKALSDSEEKFRTIFNMAEGFMCIADINTATFKVINPAFQDILGYSEQELLNKSFLEFIHPDDVESTQKVIEEQLQAGEKVLHFTNRYRSKEGRYHWFDWNSHPVPEQGITYAIAHEITELVKIQNQLKENERRFRILIDQSIDMIILHDFSGQILTANLKSAMEYGYSREDLCSMNIADLSTAETQNLYQQHFWEQLELNTPFVFETIHKRKSGSTFPIEAAITKIKVGQNIRIMAAFRNITERKQTENRLKFQSMLINNINDFVVATDEQGIITYVNEKICKAFDASASDFIGQHVRILNRENNPEEITQEYILNHVLKYKTWQGETCYNLPSGNQLILQTNVSLILNEDDQAIGTVGISSDITQRKQYEIELQHKTEELEAQNEEYLSLNEELQESLERIQEINEKLSSRDRKLSILLRASKAVIAFEPFQITAEKIFKLCKEYTGAISGYVALMNNRGDENDVIYLDAGGLKCTVDENLPMPIRGLREIAYRKAKGVYENDFMHTNWIKYMPKGHVAMRNVLFSPLIIDKKPVGLIGLANKPADFTDDDIQTIDAIAEIASIALYNSRVNDKLIEAKQHAEESDRLKSAFLANMSHEIRTPLNGILGFSSLLGNKNISDEQRALYGNIIKRSSDGLLQIISDILDISRIESGELHIVPETFNLNNLLEDLYALFRSKIIDKEKDLSLKLKKTDSELFLFTDEHRLQQVLSNLLDNALKFTDEGTISFGVDFYDKNYISFFVQDSGIGISEEFQKNIFERFQQVETGPNRLYGGTGLGLSIAAKIVELMHGELQVESELGKGARFFFRLPFQDIAPINTENPEPVKTSRNTETERSKANPISILLVEDDAMSRLFLEELINETENHLYVAKDGSEALELYKQHSIDLIFLDIRLPDISGLEIAREIRKKDKDVSIIAQTAFARKEEINKALEAGCNDYLTKPIKQEELYQKIQQYIP